MADLQSARLEVDLVADLPEVLQAVVIRPGDALILRFDDNLTEAVAARIRAKVKELLPDTPVVLVNAKEILIYRSAGGD